MKINIEITREEIESAMNLGGKYYLEVLDRPKNRELLNFLHTVVPSAMQQFSDFLKRDPEGDDGDDNGGQPHEDPAEDSSTGSSTGPSAGPSEQAA